MFGGLLDDIKLRHPEMPNPDPTHSHTLQWTLSSHPYVSFQPYFSDGLPVATSLAEVAFWLPDHDLSAHQADQFGGIYTE